MYGGDDCEETGEDVELERYGLTEGQNSGSGESDTEEALYRQVHYNIGNDNNIQSTTQGDAESNIGTDESPLTTRRASPTVNPGNGDNGETNLDTADILLTSVNDDDDNDPGYNWKNVGNDSKYNVSLRSKTKQGIADIQSSRKRKAVFIVKDDSESDVIFLDVKTNVQEMKCEEKVKQEVGNPRKRSWRKTSDNNDETNVTKIDRTSFSSARQAPEPSATPSRISKVVVIADESSSSSVVVLDSERSEEDTSQPKQRPHKDGGEFFLDSKGMALEDVNREKDSAELGWKAERMKTKAMLKEGVEIIDLSSGEEDCMAIGSCSEEEGLHVHFDEKGDQMLPNKKDTSRISKWKGRENVAPGRYFVQSRQKHIRCHNCNEMGHLKSECPQPPHIPACILCGTRGHTDRNCPDTLCFNCSLPGHQSRSCPVKRHIRYARCTRCQMQGHLRKMCPDIWRQYHLTTEHGPIIRPTSQHQRTKQKDVYCSNCSKKGHRYYDCRSARFDEFVVFTYDKVCLYDRKHIGKMEYPADNKNAEYLKLLSERKGITPTSITEKDSTKVTKEATASITKRVSSGVAGKGSRTVTKEATTSIRKDNSQPHSNKRKFSQEREKEEEPIQEKEVEIISTEKERTSKKKVLDPVHTFVRTRLFGGRKGRCWAKQDETAIFPSERKMEEMEMVRVPEDGSGKPTKAQKKAQRKALKAQKKIEAKSKRLEKPEDVVQDLAEAKRIKHSAVMAMNAVKREIKAALLKKKQKTAPLPKEVTDSMSKEQKKAMKRKIRLKERHEVQLALNEKKKVDVEVRKVDRVFKEAQKMCREAKKRKREVYGTARRAQYVPKDRQYPVRQESGYAMSQRGFKLNNRLLEVTHHQDNQWTMPQADSWEQAFPRSNVTYDFTNQLFCNSLDRAYSNNPTFTEQPHSNSPGFADGPNNPSFTDSLHSVSQSFSCPKGKRKRNRRKRKNKQGGQTGS